MNPIENLFRAGQIVGLDPREMMLNALEELAHDPRTGDSDDDTETT